MTTVEIQELLLKSLDKARHLYWCTNFRARAYFEADIMSINKNHKVFEYEIKRSRSDFRADFKKTVKHRTLVGEKTRYKRPNYFYFVSTPDVIDLSMVPEYAGLIHITPSGPKTVKQAPELHKEKAHVNLFWQMLRVLAVRHLYGCAFSKRTY